MTDTEIERFRERLSGLLSKSKETRENFAKKCGITRQTLYNLLNPDSPFAIEEKTVAAISANLGVDYGWLLKGEGQMSNDFTEGHGVPVYNRDFTAGDLTWFDDQREKIIGYVDLAGFRSCIAFVRVKGSSMFPDFTAGDFVGLEPLPNFKYIEYGHPHAIVTKFNQRYIKLIRKGKDNKHIILKSRNPNGYDDIEMEVEDIEQMFKVHGPIRDVWQ